MPVFSTVPTIVIRPPTVIDTGAATPTATAPAEPTATAESDPTATADPTVTPDPTPSTPTSTPASSPAAATSPARGSAGSGTRTGSGTGSPPGRLGPVAAWPDASANHKTAGSSAPAASGVNPTAPVGQATDSGWSSTLVTLLLLLGITVFGSAALLAFQPARRLVRPAGNG